MNNKELPPLKAIREKCLDCCNNSCAEVRKCEDTDCSLFPYRFGHNPRRSGIGNKRASFHRKDELSKVFSKENGKDDKLIEMKTKSKNLELSS
ncbi:MAG: hypothetical protein Q8O10_10230 [candidate division Zixibacteria bacterium]|nr:hypothetical protein [candidate division Zixibacteria bacterium]